MKSIKDAIRTTMDNSGFISSAYLTDLSDADLLDRPVPQANHIAWQLGHLIVSEVEMISALGRKMPALPDGFDAQHSKEASGSSDPKKFRTKAEYVALAKTVRDATLRELDATAEGDFAKPGPESMRSYAPTVGAVFQMIGIHELMHVGQFVPVRRKLGKPVAI